jgi:hypothetical protein
LGICHWDLVIPAEFAPRVREDCGLHAQPAARQYHLQLPKDVRRAETPRERENDGQPPRLLPQNPEKEAAEKEHRQLQLRSQRNTAITEQAGNPGDSSREEIAERDALPKAGRPRS